MTGQIQDHRLDRVCQKDQMEREKVIGLRVIHQVVLILRTRNRVITSSLVREFAWIV